ncbi:hypothetical protein FA95DRAFT_1577839 [Auriscalpium vulgare]|uniref:Uncharacterized protein n=1 Tax=Auriscalpium vulgare TaxID=40419 RepID=A0ACB8R4N4_9AGAM|nr:hypothetical protein FA95DRAFT_1577839 [Auriscalpium vulgare]
MPKDLHLNSASELPHCVIATSDDTLTAAVASRPNFGGGGWDTRRADGEPMSYKEAMHRSDALFWMAAWQEYDVQIANETWTLVPLARLQSAITGVEVGALCSLLRVPEAKFPRSRKLWILPYTAGERLTLLLFSRLHPPTAPLELLEDLWAAARSN